MGDRSALFRALLVGVDFGDTDFDEDMEELRRLGESAGIRPVAQIRARRDKPDAAYFVGSGKVEELRLCLRNNSASLLLFNHALSPAQQRNLEKGLEVSVVDRTQLILNIFARRARSHEGKLQVELAQLEHASTRLVKGWSHLERQRGGRGFLGGMGETQLEVDRRLIGSRVKVLKSKLARLGKQRQMQRRARAKNAVPSVSLVGYTNAGKSTLFNALTHAGAYAADQLFATLDTTSRKVYLAGLGNVVLADTVGFIRDLPHALIDAFQATLEETVHADLLLHIVDASSAVRDEQIRQVEAVLDEIGAGALPRLTVLNKIDLAKSAFASQPPLDYDEYGKISRVRISARTGVGLESLRQALTQRLADGSCNQP